MVSSGAIRSCAGDYNPAAQKRYNESSLRERAVLEASGMLEGVLAFREGDVIDVADERGNTGRVTVARVDGAVDNGDGTVNVALEDGSVAAVSKYEL